MISKSNYRKTDDHIYYNIELTNTTNFALPIKYVATRTQPLFAGNPDDYVMAITRFQVPLTSVPIMFYPKSGSSFLDIENPEEGRPDDTLWSITLDTTPIGGTVHQEFVQFFPYNTTTTNLAVYSIQHFIDLLNETFYRACQSLVPIVTNCPYLIYDEPSGIINLVAPSDNFGIGKGKIYMNSLLYNFFDNFSTFFSAGGTLGRIYQFIVKENGEGTITSKPPQLLSGNNLGASTTAYLIKGEFPNLGQLYTIRSVVFTSANLPVKPEFIPNNVASASQTSNTSSGFRNIITDFEVGLEGQQGKSIRTIQNYNSAGEYRLSDLSGTTGITTIDIQVYWSDNRGRIFPLTLNKFAYFSMKIMFRKKSFKSAI